MSYAPIPFEPTLENRASLVSQTPAASTAAHLRRNRILPGNGRLAPSDGNYPLIVHCHLQWDWVWQRPQQFMSRLSLRHRTLFIETLPPEPGLAAPLARFRTLADFPNLTLLTLQFPSWRWTDGAYVDRERRRLVTEFLVGPGAGQFEDPVQWFYDPMTVTAFGGKMGERLIVYDCMDELSRFRGAPPAIVERERELLGLADVVFTGGRKLYETKRALNNNCHFYGCGVDVEHFGKARSEHTVVPPELAGINQPILGYFGVIDERMDYELITQLAEADPHWSIVMVGPFMKVDPAQLPQRPNLIWLGQRAYAELPALCKAFDVCLMPFALNEATEFINPTKALEYMATARPIVSTAVPDVVRNFSDVIKIAPDVKSFIRLCRQALDHPDTQSIQLGLQTARENSWDSIVTRLETHVLNALRKSARSRAA